MRPRPAVTGRAASRYAAEGSDEGDDQAAGEGAGEAVATTTETAGEPAPKLATTEHGIAPDDGLYQSSGLRGRIMNLLHTLRLRVTPVKIAVSESTREVMAEKWRARNVTVVRNGVDSRRLREQVDQARQDQEPPEGDGRRVLSLSRLSPEKNLDVLLQAWALHHRDHPQDVLEIAGEGPERGRLIGLGESLGLGESVRFSGFQDPVAAMSRADLLVQLSAWENLSYTLLDAAASGLPVIAADVGGNGEILPPESLLGVLDPEKIARALQDPPRPSQARITPLERMTEQLAEVYQGAFARRLGTERA